MVKLSGNGAAGGGDAGHHPNKDKTEFKITPEQLRAAITPRTRLFILNSPSNPTGSLYTPEEIKALGDVCVEKGVLIMSDEIYEKLVYDGARTRQRRCFSRQHLRTHHSRSRAGEGLFDDGLAHRLTAAPEPIAKAIDAIQSHSTSNPTSFAQKGAVAALNGPQDHMRRLAGGIRPAPGLRMEKTK